MARSKPNGYIYSGNLRPLVCSFQEVRTIQALTAEADGAAARDLLNRALLDDTFDNAYVSRSSVSCGPREMTGLDPQHFNLPPSRSNRS